MFSSIQRIGLPAARQAVRRWYSMPVVTINLRLKADLKLAMRAKEKQRTTVIKGMLSDILYAEKNPQTASTFSRDSDADVATLIQRAIKQRQDSIKQYTDGGRADLAAAEQQEVEILNLYLPEQLSDQDIERRVRETVERLGVSGVKAMGAVMKEVGISPAEAPKSKVAAAAKRILGE
ncbi:hypothetical protein FBU59_001408 [Linderina macrospora]|uniref:Uncharacterized protein n=1 Tax=Linderina macrospora TaxID=4868 RepID=A0ACC1JDW7_9FUNG|nr:hypothetical protein FBU59_001408 [Linderina macrospora]